MTDIPNNLWHLVEWYVAFLGAVVFYAFLTNRVRSATMVLRVAFADRAERFIAAKILPEPHQRALEFALEHATDGRIPWLCVAFLPICAVPRLFNLGDKDPDIRDSKLQDDFKVTMMLWWLSVLGLSPLAALILVAETVIILLVSHPGRTVSAIANFILPIDRLLDIPKGEHRYNVR